MYNYKDITDVHLEVSEVCNAACPQCARFKGMGKTLSKEVTNATISIDFFKKIFPQEFVRQLKNINFCGVLGDPITAKDLLEEIEYLTNINPTIRIDISTNGGIRSTEWWASLGKIMNSHDRRVSFSIDGLEDTNHLYRRNVRWDLLINNAKSFIENGGYAVWQFIRFKHNEHQVDKVKELASDLGFKEIHVKDTNRFNSTDPVPVFELGGDTPTHFLAPPSDFVPKVSTPKILDEVEIKCKVQKRKEVYISAKGEILPCCYLYSNINLRPERYEHIATMDYFQVTTDKTVENIIDGGVYQKIEESWSKPSIAAGKIQRCAEICGIMNQVEIKVEKVGD